MHTSSNSLEEAPAAELQLPVIRLRVEQEHVHAAVRDHHAVEGAVQGVLARVSRQQPTRRLQVGIVMFFFRKEARAEQRFVSAGVELRAPPLQVEQVVARGSIGGDVEPGRAAVSADRCCGGFRKQEAARAGREAGCDTAAACLIVTHVASPAVEYLGRGWEVCLAAPQRFRTWRLRKQGGQRPSCAPHSDLPLAQGRRRDQGWVDTEGILALYAPQLRRYWLLPVYHFVSTKPVSISVRM